jgi:hypothetical protein
MAAPPDGYAARWLAARAVEVRRLKPPPTWIKSKSKSKGKGKFNSVADKLVAKKKGHDVAAPLLWFR